MDRKTINTLLTSSGLALAIGGLILILVSIFSETKDTWALSVALLSIILSNILNFTRISLNRRS